MTILSDALSRATTYDVTGQIDAGDRRVHRELTERLGDQPYPNATLAAVAEIQSITAGDRTGGDMDLVFTLAGGTGFSVLALAWNADAATTQAAVDAAALVANPAYEAGDFAVAGGAFGAAGSATTVTFGGPLGVGNQALITVVGTSLTGGTTDPVASESTAGVLTNPLAAVAEIQSITAGDRTGGTFDLVFTLAEGTGFSVLALDWDVIFSVVQTEVDSAALAANPTYVAGDFAVAGGAFGDSGSATTVTFGGPLGIGNQALITVVGTSLTGGTTDPVAFQLTAGIVPRFWFTALKNLGVIVGIDPIFGATPAGQYTVNLRESLENYPSNQTLRTLIKEATDQEGEDWETELLPLLGLDRLASGIEY